MTNAAIAALWKEWSIKNPAAIENDSDEWLDAWQAVVEAQRREKLAKHLPGQHDQKTHGNRGKKPVEPPMWMDDKEYGVPKPLFPEVPAYAEARKVNLNGDVITVEMHVTEYGENDSDPERVQPIKVQVYPGAVDGMWEVTFGESSIQTGKKPLVRHSGEGGEPAAIAALKTILDDRGVMLDHIEVGPKPDAWAYGEGDPNSPNFIPKVGYDPIFPAYDEARVVHDGSPNADALIKGEVTVKMHAMIPEDNGAFVKGEIYNIKVGVYDGGTWSITYTPLSTISPAGVINVTDGGPPQLGEGWAIRRLKAHLDRMGIELNNVDAGFYKLPALPELPEGQERWADPLLPGNEDWKIQAHHQYNPNLAPDAAAFFPYVKEWPGGIHNTEMEQRTKQSIVNIYKRMQEDPRWADAAAEWSKMGKTSGEDAAAQQAKAQAQKAKANEAFHKGQSLINKFEQLRYEITDEDGDWGYSEPDELPDPTDLGDYEYWEGEPVDEFEAPSFGHNQYGHPGNYPQVGQTVYTTLLTPPESWSGKPWTVEAITKEDVGLGESYMVKLREQGAQGGLFTGHIGPKGMGPQSITVDMTYLYTDGDMVIKDRDEAQVLSAKISILSNEWSKYKHEYGDDPNSVVSQIEDGEYEGSDDDDDPYDNDYPSATVDQLVVDHVRATSANREQLPQMLRDLWAETSADDHMWSLAVQKSAAREFGIEDIMLSNQQHGSGEPGTRANGQANEIVGKYGTMLQVWTRAVYNETQDDLLARGWDWVPVARGMSVDDLTVLDDDELAEQIKSHLAPRANPNDPHPGYSNMIQDDPIWMPVHAADLNPLSSWSVSPHSAAGFTHARSWKIGLRGWVRREQVWGHSLVGNGSMGEVELILLGGKDSFDGEIVASQGHVAKYLYAIAPNFGARGWELPQAPQPPQPPPWDEGSQPDFAEMVAIGQQNPAATQPDNLY